MVTERERSITNTHSQRFVETKRGDAVDPNDRNPVFKPDVYTKMDPSPKSNWEHEVQGWR